MASPLYQQIAEDLHQQIASGDLAAGSQLPTEADLKGQYRASRNTVRDAVKRLISLGLVETKPGQGTFVVEKMEPFVTTLTGNVDGFGGGEGDLYRSEIEAGNRKFAVSPVQVEIQEATEEVARGLLIDAGSEVISRHERRFIDNHPWSLQTSFYPMKLAERGAERLRGARDIPEGTVQYLADRLNIRQRGYRDWITVRALNSAEASFFRISADGRIQVYEIFRTAFDEKGEPMRLTITVYPADRNQFIINVGNVPGVNAQEGTGIPSEDPLDEAQPAHGS